MKHPSKPNEISHWIESSATAGDAVELVAWSRTTIANIERGHMMVGLVSVEEAKLIPLALRKAFALGLREAGIPLADWLIRTPLNDQDVSGAEKVLLDTLAQGGDEACLSLMRCRWFHRRNDCSDADAKQAFGLLQNWQKQHADNDEALYLLALVTCHGFGTAADPAESAKMLKKAAAMGNADAMFELFIYYAHGMGVTADDAEAAAWLMKAGDAGQVRAMYNLGAFFATGRLMKQDMQLAVKWYTSAAEAGHEKAADTLANMYEYGLGIEKNSELAERFREMAGA